MDKLLKLTEKEFEGSVPFRIGRVLAMTAGAAIAEHGYKLAVRAYKLHKSG